MFVRRLVISMCLALWLVPPATAQAPLHPLRALQQMDAQVATIGYRLAVANLDFCRNRLWLPGFVIHDLSQYPVDSRVGVAALFGMTSEPQVLAVSGQSAADRAGLRADDILVSVDGEAPPRAPEQAQPSFEGSEAILDFLERAFSDGAADLAIRRAGEDRFVRISAEQGCASRFQVVPGEGLHARADGRYVQVTSSQVTFSGSDEELAVALAHELAHNILEHRRRLNEAGIQRGLMQHFGRNARLTRETEAEADRLGVYLMARAGYDIQAAPRYWRRLSRAGLNFLGSATHPAWGPRIAAVEAEVARIERLRREGAPIIPDFVTLPLAP